MYHIWQTAPNGNWGNWASLQGHDLQQLTVGQNADGRLELFALGGDRSVYHIWQTAPNGNWGNWASLQGHDLQQLTVGQNADGSLEIFALGGDRSVYHIWQTAPNGNWTGAWNDLLVPGTLPPPPPPPPTPPPAIINYLNAAPDNGYITLGSSATLSWQVSNAERDTVVSLQGREPFGPVVLNKVRVPLTGTQTVTPSDDTKYTLTAQDGRGAVSRDTLVSVYSPNPPAGSVFYFKMTNPQSEITPCFTVAVYAKDQTTAKSIAEQQNGGYTATAIDQSQFMTACD
ncbi:hypothetical protein Misp02_01660 [Microtetraspora sp. NBRC 16547]|nr:hypothetical protein Misp02_01660 [Microtetraspora sp. NBRC 16547]